jgi:hypothetical protein
VPRTATVELLYFEGCPNHDAARDLVERIAAEETVTLDLRLIEVISPEDAEERRFLGSPSVRIDGHDVEPGADERGIFVFACRVYQSEEGLSGLPAEPWIRTALRA